RPNNTKESKNDIRCLIELAASVRNKKHKNKKRSYFARVGLGGLRCHSMRQERPRQPTRHHRGLCGRQTTSNGGNCVAHHFLWLRDRVLSGTFGIYQACFGVMGSDFWFQPNTFLTEEDQKLFLLIKSQHNW
ncbi:Hypothetical predicted protein, partial [Prunus dulcis]